MRRILFEEGGVLAGGNRVSRELESNCPGNASPRRLNDYGIRHHAPSEALAAGSRLGRCFPGPHENPHGDQFTVELASGDCSACHTVAENFWIRPFDHEQGTGFALRGAHYRADCNGCHIKGSATSGEAVSDLRRYRGTPKECSSCHKDAHQGQFTDYGSENCTKCHTSQWDWKALGFDHNIESRFPLEGAHVEVPCSRCHMKVTLENKIEVVQYKPLGMECRDCHDIIPGSTRGRVR